MTTTRNGVDFERLIRELEPGLGRLAANRGRIILYYLFSNNDRGGG